VLKNIFSDENIIENNTFVYGKHRSKDIRDNSHQNIIFLKLKLVCHLSRINNSANSETELLRDQVGESELSFVK
jgi:hypothetical protein